MVDTGLPNTSGGRGRNRAVKRAFVALGLSTLLLATISPPTPAVETPWQAFSFRNGADGYAPAPIDRPVLTAPERPTRAEVAVLDEQTTLVLESGSLTVLHRDQEVWSSDPTWDVRQLLVGDVDNGDQQEVALVLWKPYHREPSIMFDSFHFESPWEEGSLRNHLFVYGWGEDGWQPLWCSSPIADPIHEMAVGDVDGDGGNELVVLEGNYADTPDAPAGHLAVWRWTGWGFSLQWRSAPRAFHSLSLRDVTGDEALEILVTSEP
jgi:hypothetical protein